MSYRTYGDPVDPPREKAERALRAWSDFPVSRVPRPLVLLGDAVQPGGFPDAQAKIAFMRGAIDAVPGFPAAVLTALRAHLQPHGGPRVLVTAARAGTSEFVTDRGRRRLPAWIVHARDIPAPITVLDPSAGRQAWRPSGSPDQPGWRGSTAVAGEGGQVVTLRFTGSPFAYADYPRADVLETDTAVAIIPVAVSTGVPGPWLAYAQQREVTVRLAGPLGPRILLDQHGAPVMAEI